MRKLYKKHTGKRFRRKKDSSDSALEQLRNTSVELGMYGSVKLSNVENILDKQRKLLQKHINSVTPEVAAPTAETNTFTPTVSSMEFQEYQAWQRCGRGPMPTWFMSDDTKASDIMNNYDKLIKLYC